MKTCWAVKFGLALVCSVAFMAVQNANAKDKTTTAVVSSANPAVIGQPVTVTATVTSDKTGNPVPTGAVTFTDGTTAVGTVGLNAAGQATFSGMNLSLGSHVFSATYNGDGAY